MTVQALIKELQKCDPRALVVMSTDSEGNMYSPLADLDDRYNYAADTTYSGEIGFRKLTPELKEKGYSREDTVKGRKAVVLWPTN